MVNSACDNEFMNRSFPPYIILLLLAGFWICACPVKLFAQISFNQDIRPILSRHCTACHGPDEEGRQADLRLDTFDGATEYAIEPGDPDSSELIARVTSQDDPMPPAEHGHPLSEAEVRLLRQWIQEGATYETHWSFVKPDPPQVPHVDGPHQEQPIDQFVLKKLQQNLKTGLGDAADPARLIRRLALDLTGLPPDRDMTDSFVADPSLENYERIVDELLADSSFGEHWASMWLDLARYADTMGYAGDETRTIWPWRDWLIKSLNDNMPFDQFTREVLAGDLLTNATEAQRLATAFHRNTLNNNEGGTNDEEFRTIAVKDRISTTLNTWMGLTLRCAECHSHKYDPISTREYYEFLDFFNQTADADRGDEYPRIELRPESLRSMIAELDVQIEELRIRQQQKTPFWKTTTPIKATSENGSVLTIENDGSVLATGPNPIQDTYSLSLDFRAGTISGLQIEILPDGYHTGKVGRGDGGAFVLTQVRVDAGQQPVSLKSAAADYAQSGFEPVHVIRKQVAERDEPLGWAVHHKQQGFGQERTLVVEFEKPVVFVDATRLDVHLVFNSQWHHSNAGRVRVSTTEILNPVDRFNRKQIDPLQRQIDQLVARRNEPVRVPVLSDLPQDKRRTTHIMKRGNFQNLGEPVSASTPAAFNPFRDDLSRDRLGVAEWLVSEDNPLTARVTVNRYWARLFGRGLVVTEEDFGTQGSPPSHPDLLDWLAVEFRKDWNSKRVIKQIVMSGTYRQSGKATREQMEADPDNIYLARGPRNRLPAETIRDQALAVSGLLSRKMYGPPVYPPNPIKQVVNAFKGADVWKTSTGEDRYRRSIYTFLKRSQPHPLFETFDTATRDVCSLRRINTNTPLQSFMTLNDETFVEAAQALAFRMTAENQPREQIARGLELALGRKADPARIEPLLDLYDKTHESFESEPQQAQEMIGSYSKKFRSDEFPEMAALTVVANVILNLDEFLTR